MVGLELEDAEWPLALIGELASRMANERPTAENSFIGSV
jgi:hypothetical protein